MGAAAAAATGGVTAVAAKADTPPRKTLRERGNCGDIVGLRISSMNRFKPERSGLVNPADPNSPVPQ
ncbi:hypothetical protein GCM10017567_32500 [Amycolatopsis bullii]|uniref:Uncharacterized protein n=1 Tax=Amycolatopsis bullii TaxID=941987 RepID=A0ABQ3KEF7_9PSEU|nr:hypothetical protein GCM10017567_32500 [Amycolatopsis bullii]